MKYQKSRLLAASAANLCRAILKMTAALAVLQNISPVGATTVAYDGVTLAADSQTTTSNLKQFDFQKIHRIKGSLVGTCGTATDGLKFIHWLESADREFDEFPTMESGFRAIVVDKGEVFEYENCEYPLPSKAPVAIGSGKDFAMGAMLAGKTAADAVRIAEKLDIYTGGEVKELPLVEPCKPSSR